jgi:hypothetical protein
VLAPTIVAAAPLNGRPTSIDPVLTVIGVLLVIALLSLLARWAFSPAPRLSARRVTSDAQPDDFGLLTAVATAPTREDAEMLREVLTSHGIRCTIAPAGDSGGGRKRPMQVLVFLGDADRAKTLVGTR